MHTAFRRAAIQHKGHQGHRGQDREDPFLCVLCSLGVLCGGEGVGAVMIRSGVAGIARRSKPACRSALITAGAGPSIGISPTPLAPNGPCLYGFSSIATAIGGVSSVVGTR